MPSSTRVPAMQYSKGILLSHTFHAINMLLCKLSAAASHLLLGQMLAGLYVPAGSLHALGGSKAGDLNST